MPSCGKKPKTLDVVLTCEYILLKPSMAKKMNTPYFPDDVVLQILSKLPVKSLLRFKSVSKQWRSLISNSGFKLSIQRKRALLLSIGNYYQILDDDFSVQNLPDPNIRDPEWRKNSLYLWNLNTKFRGSCNGLILISVGNSLYLWNPSTRSHFCEVLNSAFLRNDEYHIGASGLCYDSSTDDYKVVLAVISTYPKRYDNFVIVSSCKSKCWKRIDFPYNIPSVQEGPSLNGYLHWGVQNINNINGVPRITPNSVVYFDPVSEIFKMFPTPDEDEYYIMGLGELDGCLCMARRGKSQISHPKKIEIWVMKKYDEMGSWKMLFSASECDFMELKALFRAKSGEILMARSIKCEKNSRLRILTKTLDYYDAKKNWIRGIPTNRGHLNDIEAFVESLVSPEAYC